MTLQIRALLLALTIGSVLAQPEPDVTAPVLAQNIRASQEPISLTSLLREQASRQQRISPTTTTDSPTTASLSSTTLTTPQTVSNNVPSATPFINTITLQETEPLSTSSKPQFQYVKPLSAAKCHYNNQTYSIGQKWNDDCLQVCECVAADEMALIAINACRNRCPIYKDPPGDGCTLQRSKFDECCLDWICDSEGKLAPSITTTIMNTERGQLNVSTTEIKLPSSTSQQSSTTQTMVQFSSTPTTTTLAPPFTMTIATRASNQQTQQKKVITTTTQQQVPTTTTTSMPQVRRIAQPNITTNQPVALSPTTTSSNSNSNRAPKQVISSTAERAALSQILATQSPNNLTAQRAQSLITTTSQPPATSTVLVTQTTSRELGQRMLQSVAVTGPEVEARQNNIFFPSLSPSTTTTTTTTTTTEASPNYEEADPEDMDLCIQAMDLGAYKVNQSWLEEPCNQSCRCVFRSEPRDPTVDVRFQQTINMKQNSEQTEIRCGLPPHCASVALKLTSSSECQNPRLIFPQQSLDKCACPRVVCAQPVDFQQMKTTTTTTAAVTKPVTIPPKPTTTVSYITTKASSLAPSSTLDGDLVIDNQFIKGCKSRQQGGRALTFGETFNDECHSTCRCMEDSEIRCQQLTCPLEPPTDIACAEWAIEQNFKPNSTENRCCPQFVCKEPVLKFKGCLLMGKETRHGERLPEEIHPRNPECEKVCTCNDGKIICQPLCPTLSDLPPEDLNCTPEQAYRTSDECCPKWLCPITEDYALQDFDVVPMNSTAVEVSFVLPLFAVGRRGKAELNYTGLPLNEAPSDQPPTNANWIRRANIKTTNGIFSSQSVKYHLINLKPNHKYWFKLVVHFFEAEQPFDEPLESQIQKVVMPPVAAAIETAAETSVISKQTTLGSSTTTSSTSTSTTTTITTAAPTRILQPVHSQPVDSSTGSTSPSDVKSTITSTSTATASSTTTTEQPISTVVSSTPTITAKPTPIDEIFKPEITGHVPPCGKNYDIQNQIDDRLPLPWTDIVQTHMNAPLQRYAWHLLIAFSIMTILFTIVSYLYLKRSSRVIAPITSQSAYDNPTFTKLVSYYANQPHVLLVDENNQNYNNDAILAKQKNLEVDKSSPLNHHNHQVNDIHHHNGRQHLI